MVASMIVHLKPFWKRVSAVLGQVGRWTLLGVVSASR
jgi:hypothetical protein